MWIKHNGILYNLQKYRMIYKSRDEKHIVLSNDVLQDKSLLEFESIELADEYFREIERKIFNLGNSYE